MAIDAQLASGGGNFHGECLEECPGGLPEVRVRIPVRDYCM